MLSDRYDEAADVAVQAPVVVVIEDVAVGIGHAGQPAVVGAAGHLRVSVLHLRRRRGVHGAAVGLVLAGQLAQAVVDVFHLVDDAAAAGRVVAGDEIGVALRVVGVSMRRTAPSTPLPSVVTASDVSRPSTS